MERPNWAPEEIDLRRPSAARMYDYYLGGMHNFAIDRAMAEQGITVYPGLPRIMRANRAFLQRAVRFLGDAGIDQFLDIGAGIPTVGNVHQIAQRHNPMASVVYVDIDPIAVAHGRALLADNPLATALGGDVRQAKRILTDPQVRKLIDFDRPVGLLLVALLHFISDADDPAAIIAELRDALPAGSYVAVSHFSNEGDPEQVEGLRRLSKGTPTPLTLRSRSEIAALLDGFDLVDPGLVYLPQWRPEKSDVDEYPEWFNDFCAVGRKL